MFHKLNSKHIDTKMPWQDVIKVGVELLKANHIAGMGLYDAIIANTEQYGAYYVIDKGIALAHAPVGDYNYKPGVSLVLMSDYIQFNDEDKWAKIIITLSAIDASSHMQFIKEFGEIFGNQILKGKLLNVHSLQQFLEIYPKKGGVSDN